MRYSILYFLLPLCLAVSCCSLKSNQTFIDFENLVALITLNQGEYVIGTGSGTVIDVQEGEETNNIAVLTAKHVVESDKDNVYIQVVLNGFTYDVSEVVLHESYDIAVLRFETSYVLDHAEIDNDNPEPIEEVYAAGYPMRIGLIVSHGISNYQVQIDPARGYAPMFFCTAPIYPGNSGGAVFSKKTGKLIGVTVMVGAAVSYYGKNPVPHIHYFIPTAAVSDWIQGVINVI